MAYCTILITGGAGFIGSHLVRRFVQHYPDYKILNLDSLTYAGNLANLADIETAPNYQFIKGDISDADLIGKLFKEQAIEFAWQFLTQTLQLPKEKLWVSIYQNDDEAFHIWTNNIGFPQERISRCGDDSNFWSMGDTGPCGPCSEIFYDHGEDVPGGLPGTQDVTPLKTSETP